MPGPGRTRLGSALSALVLGLAVVAGVYAVVTAVPGAEIFAPDGLVAGLFGVPLFFVVVWVFICIGKAGIGRLRGDRSSERQMAELASTWLKVWSRQTRQFLQVGFAVAVVLFAVSLFRLRHGNPA